MRAISVNRGDVIARDAGTAPEAAVRPHRIEVGEGLRGSGVWEAYRATIAYLFDIAQPENANLDAFTIYSAAWQAVHTSLRRSRGSAHTLRRSPDLIAHGADQILVYAQLSGHVDHRCGGRVDRVEPGDVVIYDYARPFESVAGDFENLGLLLSRDLVPTALLAEEAHGFRLPGTSGIAQMLVSGLTALEATAGRLTMGEFEAAAVALASIASEPLRARTERRDTKSHPLAMSDQLRAQALAFIDNHLGDRALSPDRIADHLALSRSALYRLFESYGGVRLMILARRLDRAVQVLLDEPDTHRALGQLAKRHGFPTTAHFSRLFSERFGMPPSQYCALIREGDTAWLAAQHTRMRFTNDLTAAWQDLGARRLGA